MGEAAREESEMFHVAVFELQFALCGFEQVFAGWRRCLWVR